MYILRDSLAVLYHLSSNIIHLILAGEVMTVVLYKRLDQLSIQIQTTAGKTNILPMNLRLCHPVVPGLMPHNYPYTSSLERLGPSLMPSLRHPTESERWRDK